jgi:hypothetical protein
MLLDSLLRIGFVALNVPWVMLLPEASFICMFVMDSLLSAFIPLNWLNVPLWFIEVSLPSTPPNTVSTPPWDILELAAADYCAFFSSSSAFFFVISYLISFSSSI